MGIEINTLLDDLRGIFGDAFGESQPAVLNVQEACEVYVQEGQRPSPRVEPSRKERFGRGQQPLPKFPSDGKSHPKRPLPTNRDIRKGITRHIPGQPRQEPNKEPDVDAVRRDMDREQQRKDYDAQWEPTQRRAKVHKRHPHVPFKTVKGFAQGNQDNYPFKRNTNIGPGPGTPSGAKVANPVGKREVKEKQCWHCICPDGTYKGCHCKGTGKDDTCPKGKIKNIKIKASYHRAYNDDYHEFEREHGNIEKRKPEPEQGAKWSNKHQDSASLAKKLHDPNSEL